MWKKAAWVYLAIYTIGVGYINISAMIKNSAEKGFDYSSIITFLFFLLPAVLVAYELLGLIKSKLFTFIFAFIEIVAFLFVALMVLGNFSFNTVGVEMFAKALLFIPMLGCLGYYIYTKLFQKKVPAASA
jgi:hypothetical protein